LPESDARDDLALLTEAALAAGEIARRHFGNGPATWDKGSGLGPVSEADLEIDAMLRARLLAARPDYGWLSEETEDDPARLSARRVFIIDPIDGTRAFLDGQQGFAHALAVAEEGSVRTGVVHLPMLDKTYGALAGGGAWLNDHQMAVQGGAPRLPGARLLAGRKQMEPQHWRDGAAPDVERHFRSSLAWRLCLVAEGSFDGTLTHHDTWEWDTAAAALIAAEAGVCVTDRSGAALVFNRPHPASRGLLAAPPALHAGLLARLA
jgi:myo-inositol-1(or 4)-monophosphatase